MVKLFLVLALFLALFQVTLADQTCDNGVDSIRGCLCYSGFVQDTFGNCTNDVAGYYDCLFGTADPLITGPVLVFEQSLTYVSDNTLTLTVSSPPIRGRYFSSVGVGSCQYPASYDEAWVKTFDSSCVDYYQANITVSDLNTFCDFDVTSDDTNTYISGDVNAVAVDPLPALRGVEITRSTTSSLLFEITLPNVVTLTSQDITILSPIDLQAAVTGQSYDRTSDVGTIIISTSVQYPWALSDIYLVGTTNSLPTWVYLSDNTGCPDDGSSNCFQVWEFDIGQIVNSSTCYLDGSYDFQFSFSCQPSFNQTNGCPVTESNTTSITAQLASEDLCGKVCIVSNIAGTLTSEELFYAPGEHIYLDFEITADVDINSVEVLSVRVVQEVSLEIYNGTELGPVDFTLETDENTGTIGFDAVTDVAPNYFIFDASGGQDVFTFYVEADISVTYETYHITRKKREALTSKLTVSKELVIDISKARSAATELLAPNAAPATAAFTAGSVLATAAATAGLLALF